MKLYDFVAQFGQLDALEFRKRFQHPFLLETRDFCEAEQQRRLFLARGTKDAPLIIGRGPRCHIPIRDPMVSTRHAELVPPQAPGRAWGLVDRGSTNGTFLEGKRLAPNVLTPLRDDARLTFGQASHFLFLHLPSFQREMETLVLEREDFEEQTETFGTTLHGQIMASPVPMQARPAQRPRPAPGDQELLLFCDGQDPVPLGLGATHVIGRKAENADIVLAHQHVSRRHVELQRRAEGVFARDLGSANGTFVDSLSVRLGGEWTPLSPGQGLLIGPFRVNIGRPQDSNAEFNRTMVMDGGGLRFDLKVKPLSEMLEKIEEDKHTGSLVIQGKTVAGLISFLSGEPCDANTNEGHEGADAVRRLLGEDEGSYLLRPTLEQGGSRKISRSFAEIMLDHFLSQA